MLQWIDRAEPDRKAIRILEGFRIKVHDGICTSGETYYCSFSRGTVHRLDPWNRNRQEEKRYVSLHSDQVNSRPDTNSSNTSSSLRG